MKLSNILSVTTLLTASVLSVPSAAPQSARPAGSIQGTALQWGSNRGLGKASIELRGGGVSSAQPLKTTTDSEGKYYFTGLQPGSYRLLVKRDGYVAAEYGQQWLNGPGQPVSLTAGQALSGLDIPMMAATTISGRVTDSRGAPAVNVQVSALKVSYQGLQRVLRTVQEARTNQDGEYRLFWLTPGRYYVAAVATGWNTNGQIIVNGDANASPGGEPYTTNTQTRTVLGQNPTAGAANFIVNGNAVQARGSATTLAPVFFPAETSVDFASPIDAASGAEYRGSDIRLIPVPMYHVCGTVSVLGDVRPPDPPGATGPRGGISTQLPLVSPNIEDALRGGPNQGLQSAVTAVQAANDICPGLAGGAPLPQQARGQARLMAVGARANVSNANTGSYTTAIDANSGRFVFRNVVPGMYELSTSTQTTPENPGFNARTPVEVRGDVDFVSLVLQQGFDLKARLNVEIPPSGKTPEIGNLLRPYLGDDPPSPRDPFLGGFTNNETLIKNLPRDDYRVYVQPLNNSVVAPAVQRSPALQDVYIKSITYAGEDALNAPLRYSADPEATLDITIGANPGVLEGRVLNTNGDPAVGALVTLVANAPGGRVFRTDMYRAVSTGRDGRFQAKGIPPGDYRVFAWAGIERDAWMDPDLQRANEEQGRSIRIEEGGNTSIDLPLITPYLR
ncbi:MAG TPA: carboxypeptidase-like regulatory domain-containing protein [Terriglobia bacterium]|nr:carboxypeptidase-like regulatory domain-containing protein [Terriglobia bacterium]